MRLVLSILLFVNYGFAEVIVSPESFAEQVIAEGHAEKEITLDVGLQEFIAGKLKRYKLPYAAVVALEPSTGEIKAISSFSAYGEPYDELSTKALFPAASLFKIITAAAAIEVAGLKTNQLIYYRGGQYTLNKYNYLPHSKKDKKSIDFALAMAKSTNPAFARVALNHLNLGDLEQYALKFGLGGAIPFDSAVDAGEVYLPADKYQMARAAAGFGQVKISPLHAALIMSGIANEGVMMRPYLLKGQAPVPFQQAVDGETASQLQDMLALTTTEGTAKRHFRTLHKSYGDKLKIYSKTGTLSGKDPKGINFWFAGTLEHEGRELALAVLICDDGTARVRSVYLAKEITDYWLNQAS